MLVATAFVCSDIWFSILWPGIPLQTESLNNHKGFYCRIVLKSRLNYALWDLN